MDIFVTKGFRVLDHSAQILMRAVWWSDWQVSHLPWRRLSRDPPPLVLTSLNEASALWSVEVGTTADIVLRSAAEEDKIR